RLRACAPDIRTVGWSATRDRARAPSRDRARSRLQHHADLPLAALREGAPRLLEDDEREAVRDEARDVDLLLGEEHEPSRGDTLRVREGAEDVEVAADDRGEIDPGELDARAGRAAEHDAAAAARHRDRLPCGLGGARELHHQVRGAREPGGPRAVPDLAPQA